MAKSTEQVFQDHSEALANKDFATLMAGYADDAVLVTIDGACVGKAAIQEWFASTLAANPNLQLTPTGHRVHDECVLETWTAESDIASMPQGVDTFIIQDDRIRLQTVWFSATPK